MKGVSKICLFLQVRLLAEKVSDTPESQDDREKQVN